MTQRPVERVYYRIKELVRMGYPRERLLEACRSGKIGRKSDPAADRGYHWLVTRKEAEEMWEASGAAMDLAGRV